MVEPEGLNPFKPIEIRKQTEMLNPLALHKAPAHWKNKFFIDNLTNRTTKIHRVIGFNEFPVNEWNRIGDFEEWVLSRRDLFPDRFQYYILLGRRNTRQRKGRRKWGRGNWHPYVSIAKFHINDRKEVIYETERGVIKGSYKRKRGKYLLLVWFPRNRRY